MEELELEIRRRFIVKWCLLHSIRGRSFFQLRQGFEFGGKTLFSYHHYHKWGWCTQLQERQALLIGAPRSTSMKVKTSAVKNVNKGGRSWKGQLVFTSLLFVTLYDYNHRLVSNQTKRKPSLWVPCWEQNGVKKKRRAVTVDRQNFQYICPHNIKSSLNFQWLHKIKALSHFLSCSVTGGVPVAVSLTWELQTVELLFVGPYFVD